MEQDSSSHTGVVLRPARPRDVAALVALDVLCFGERAWTPRAWWEAVLEPSWTTLALWRNGELAGASVLLLWPPIATVASIAVHPRHRRVGLGTTLVRDAVARARAARIRGLALEVDADNGAVRLYRNEGFGTLRRFREDGRRRLEMIRRLGGRGGPPPRA